MNLKNYLLMKMAEAESGEQPGTTSAGESTSQTPTPSANTDETVGDEPASTDDWGFLSEADEEGESDGQPPQGQQQPPAQQPPQQPEGKPKEAESPHQPEPPAQQPKPEEKPPEQTPAQAPKTREQLEQETREALAKQEKELEKFYKLPDDLAQKLETEPETVLPQLAAKMHLAVMSELRGMVGELVGRGIVEHQQLTAKEAAAKDFFYQGWPQLKDKPEAEALIFQFGEMAAKNPGLDTAEKRRDMVGRMVMTALGLQPMAQPPAGNGQQPAPQQPQQPAQPRNTGFRPANPGGVGGGAPPKKEANEFANLAQEFIDEDALP